MADPRSARPLRTLLSGAARIAARAVAAPLRRTAPFKEAEELRVEAEELRVQVGALESRLLELLVEIERLTDRLQDPAG